MKHVVSTDSHTAFLISIIITVYFDKYDMGVIAAVAAACPVPSWGCGLLRGPMHGSIPRSLGMPCPIVYPVDIAARSCFPREFQHAPRPVDFLESMDMSTSPIEALLLITIYQQDRRRPRWFLLPDLGECLAEHGRIPSCRGFLVMTAAITHGLIETFEDLLHGRN
jgi:hypothetical protein